MGQPCLQDFFLRSELLTIDDLPDFLGKSDVMMLHSISLVSTKPLTEPKLYFFSVLWSANSLLKCQDGVGPEKQVYRNMWHSTERYLDYT